MQISVNFKDLRKALKTKLKLVLDKDKVDDGTYKDDISLDVIPELKLELLAKDDIYVHSKSTEDYKVYHLVFKPITMDKKVYNIDVKLTINNDSSIKDLEIVIENKLNYYNTIRTTLDNEVVIDKDGEKFKKFLVDLILVLIK